MDGRSAAFCMRYISGPKNLTGGEDSGMEKRTHPRQNNVSFIQILSPGNRPDMKLFEIMAIKAMKSTDIGEKFYASCASENTSLIVGCKSKSQLTLIKSTSTSSLPRYYFPNFKDKGMRGVVQELLRSSNYEDCVAR